MKNTAAIILAAGDGTRMKSALPKVLIEVLFQPMLDWVLDSVERAGVSAVSVVTGSRSDFVISHLEKRSKSLDRVPYKIFIQKERRGTADAVMSAKELLESGVSDVLVLCGDAPFMDHKTIKNAYDLHKLQENYVTVITADVKNPGSYGRIKRNPHSLLLSRIVEAKDCTPEELLITEVNSAAYWFDSKKLLEILPRINNNNKSGEYYLPDAIELIIMDSDKSCCRSRAGTFKVADDLIVRGANNRKQLRELNDIMTGKINDTHYENGVEIIGHNVIIGKDVEIGRDTRIMPNTIIKGKTVIGSGCEIGPSATIEDCIIDDNVSINFIKAYGSVFDKGVTAGPFVNIRPGSHIKKGAHIGNFSEVKNSDIGEGTKVAHLSYIGDSNVGNDVNIGGGCITANYDGIKKFRTVINDGAFIGCNTNLIAPVNIGENATTAAGSTITKDVPQNALAIERGATVVKENWEKNIKRSEKRKKIKEENN